MLRLVATSILMFISGFIGYMIAKDFYKNN